MVDEGEAFLIAGLRAKIGRGGDLKSAYRQWYARHLEEHRAHANRAARKLESPGGEPWPVSRFVRSSIMFGPALHPGDYPCPLMGGIALSAWNHPTAHTRDVDLLIGVDSAHLDSVIVRLREFSCRPKREPPIIEVGELHFAQFLYTPPGEFYEVQFDLMLAESPFQKSALARRVRRNVPGVDSPVDVLNCDDLILFKLLAGRLIDRTDAAMLLRENRAAIDFNYLLSWVGHLRLNAELVEIWREAFADEDPPVATSS